MGPAADPASLLGLACDVALEAGELLASRTTRPAVLTTKSSPTDVVTEMDRAAERLIRDRIWAARPGDAILGEEGGELPGPGTAGPAPVRWIVDPLDGTVNYLYGLPDWAVSIAAEADGMVVAGAVCVPARGVLYGGVLGGGSWRSAASAGASRVPLRRTSDVPLGSALIATGFGYLAGRRAVQGEVLAVLLPLVRDIRRGGACAVDLCSLAAGNVDGYYERGVQPWDIAAGSLIAAEAGAVVAGLAGARAGPEMTVGAGPRLFAELSELLVRLRADRDAPT